ncbi:hypothetical protein H257_12297 [Aphanomyces astaci]|uniref:DDE Tnp4 domain-containing protein n=1 Tax=Aphanomyces astaci TaxID=112090 RepID=W4G212_APHAT|nr:hypothetical protein H257_12297 [Aphanomyces astaci]ETV72973.1 hypothetical protein H257_12297 [Aphanomyces astaci]|eukprot:XP_009837759.1 hypothetical protein H257_12297 [Aphanomyces astaci]
MTNISPSEFNVIWANVRIYVTKHWNVGSGRKSEVSARDLLLTTVGEKYSMALLTTSGHQFANFQFVRYVTDVTFQQTNVPSGSYVEKKTYFSGKHSQYGHKVEVPVLPNGFAINSDKRYQGIQRVVRAVLPKKKLAGGILTLEDVRSNITLQAITYRWSRDNYDVLFQTCMALTNVHIRLHPLRADDGEVYSQYINRMSSIGSKKDKGKKTSARTYRMKLKAR